VTLDRLDAEKIRILNDWAEGLQRDDRADVAAAGRAIVMLVDEIERLHVMLWNRRLTAPQEPAPEPAWVPPAPAAEPALPVTHVDELERLARLHDSGALTDAEFAAEKAALLGKEPVA